MSPDVSIIIVNFNKPDLTRRCLEHIWQHGSESHSCEIIVVDNGSSAENLARLREIEGDFELIALNRNRYFGEGNNIGVERARGRYLVFLNNDAFVTAHWLEPLIDTLGRDDAGAAAPRFFYPDGRLQEAGAFVDEIGQPMQVGKFGYDYPEDLLQRRIVDYGSAACLAVKRDLFQHIGGFDLVFEPAYYEDVDLCLKLASLGKFTYCCPDSSVVHIENATSAEHSALLGFPSIIDINRGKFLERWGSWLKHRSESIDSSWPVYDPPLVLTAPVRPAARRDRVAFYAPFDLVAGEAHRYFFTAAFALSETHEVLVVVDEAYSHLRLASLGREFGVDLSALRLVKRSELGDAGDVDCVVTMEDGSLGSSSLVGRRTIRIDLGRLPPSDTEDAHDRNIRPDAGEIIVPSAFVGNRRAAPVLPGGVPQTTPHLIPPAIRQPPNLAPLRKEPFRVASIGDFTADVHNPRHDVLIEAARALAARGIAIDLHLTGALKAEPEYRACLAALKHRAEGLNVTFHPNASPSSVAALLRTCRFYWHARGYGVDGLVHPERCEQLGTGILEAMAAGCVPFVHASGAPPEYVEHDGNGVVYGSADELVETFGRLAAQPDKVEAMAAKAQERAQDFSMARFAERWRDLIA